MSADLPPLCSAVKGVPGIGGVPCLLSQHHLGPHRWAGEHGSGGRRLCWTEGPQGARCEGTEGHQGPHSADELRWAGGLVLDQDTAAVWIGDRVMGRILCWAEGPEGAHCEGDQGHQGPHGADELRWAQGWTPADTTPATEPDQVQTLEVRGFRGRVWQRVGPSLVSWRGVVILDDQGVHIELVGEQGPRAGGLVLDQDTAAVWIPWHAVHLVEQAIDPTP